MELLYFSDTSGEPRLQSGFLGQIAMATSIDDGVSLHWGDMLVIAAYFLISIGVGVWVSICRVFLDNNRSKVADPRRAPHFY